MRSRLTKTQRLIWAGQRLYPDVPLYNMAFGVRIEGPIDRGRFERSVQALIDEGEPFRTVFGEEDGEPWQQVLPSIDCEIDYLDFTGDPDPIDRSREWLDERCRRMLDLEIRPFDIALLKIADERYVWYFNQHHIVADAWSTGIAFRYVSDCYERLGAHDREPFPELPAYGPFVSYEAAGQGDQALTEAREYWAARQIDAAETPPDYYGVPAGSTGPRSERVTLELGRERSDRLRRLAANPELGSLTPQLSVFNVFATVLFAYLHRIRGRQSTTLGVPAHNRVTDTFRKTLGLFIELFPLNVEITENETFRSMLRRVQQESISFLRKARPGTSDTQANRSFSTVLNFIDVSLPDFNGFPKTTKWLHPGFVDPAHHLRIEMHDLDDTGEWTLLVDANADVFDESQRKLVAQHITIMLDAFLEDPDQTIGTVELVTESERRRLMKWSGEESSGTVPTKTILNVFDERVAENRESPAVVADGHSLTYAELDARSRKLATLLVRRGVRPDSIVGLYHDRSVDLVVGILGILRAGAAWLPISPADPIQRANFMLADAQVSELVTQERFADRFSDFAGVVIALDAPEDLPAPDESLLEGVRVDPESLSYVIYTSGSTGEPKGALNTHRGVVCLAEALRKRVYSLHDGRLNVAMVAPSVFDLSVQQIFGALLLGQTLYIVPEETRRDGARLYSFLQEHQIDVSDGTPAHLRLLIEGTRELLPSIQVRHFIIAGEALPSKLVDRFFTRFRSSQVRITNAYGVAECAVLSTSQLADGARLDLYPTIPIGTPLERSRIYVVNDHLRLQPIGVSGELCVAGPGVGRGYLNRDELTDAKFVSDLSDPSKKMYRTGDIARFLPDGRLLFLGRRDSQVKIRGYRIELAEIEHRLRSYNQQAHQAVLAPSADDKSGVLEIRDAAVLDIDAGEGVRTLCAYFAADGDVVVSELRAHLARHVPEYMIPSHFLRVDRIPITGNGKVDRRALPSPDGSRPNLESQPVLPRNPTEEQLTTIWSEVLVVESIGVHDRFLDLGGTSLDAVQLMTLVNDSFGTELPLASVFDTSTIARLAERIEQVLTAEVERFTAEQVAAAMEGRQVD